MVIQGFANGVERVVRETQKLTDGFEDVFGEDMADPGNDVRRDNVTKRVVADAPSSSDRMSRKLSLNTDAPDLSFGRGKQKDNEKQERRFF